MSKYRVLVLALLCIYSIEAQASNCTTYDLSKKPFLSAEFKQEIRGWCFAFAASATVSSLVQQSVSASDLAFHHNIRESQAEATVAELPEEILAIPLENVSSKSIFEFSGGSVTEAANLLLKKGYCPESRLGSAIEKHNDTVATFIARTSKELLEFVDQKCSPRISAQGFVEFMVTFTDDDKQKAKSMIEKSLNKNLVPSVSLDGNLILQASQQPVKSRRLIHAVAIVGQKLNEQNVCEYIIRDSATGKNLKISREKVLSSMDELYYPQKDSGAAKNAQSYLELPAY